MTAHRVIDPGCTVSLHVLDTADLPDNLDADHLTAQAARLVPINTWDPDRHAGTRPTPSPALIDRMAPYVADAALITAAFATLGRGNHFIETGYLYHTGPAAPAILIHTGSRTLGVAVARRWPATLDHPIHDAQLHDLEAWVRESHAAIAVRLAEHAHTRIVASTYTIHGVINRNGRYRPGLVRIAAHADTLVLTRPKSPTYTVRLKHPTNPKLQIPHAAEDGNAIRPPTARITGQFNPIAAYNWHCQQPVT